GGRRIRFFGVFAVADQKGSRCDEQHSGPAPKIDLFVKEKLSRQGGDNKTEGSQWPDKADIAYGQHIKQRAIEKGFESGAQKNFAIARAVLDDAEDLTGREISIARVDFLEAAAEDGDADGFNNGGDDQDEKNFSHDSQVL